MEFLNHLSDWVDVTSGDYRPEIAWLFRIIAAVIVLFLGYVLAKFVSGLIAKGINRISFIRSANEDAVNSDTTIGASIGQALFYLLLLAVAAVALAIVGLTQVVEPVQNMWDQILGFLPQFVGFALILGLGLIFAGIVKKMVESVLQAAKFDSMLAKSGVTSAAASSGSLTSAVGWIAYALVVIPIVVMALDVLNIDAISTPATLMLNEVGAAVPRIAIAGVVLVIAYLISRFVVMLIMQILPQFGVDNYFAKLGVLEDQSESGLTATKAIANVVGIVIMLFGAVEATKLIGFDILSDFVEIILEQGGQILFGTIIIIVGFILAGFVGKVLDAAGSGVSDVMASVVKYVIMALAVILGLSRMGLDPSGGQFILNVTEYLVMAVAVAIGVGGAIAFGLGGREWAGEKLRQWDGEISFRPSAPKAAKAEPAPASPAAVKPAARTTSAKTTAAKTPRKPRTPTTPKKT